MRDMLWGAATAAYQVEGATDCGGKGENSWDEFYKHNSLGYNGKTAVDHYHRVDEDLRLFHEIGLQSYRFSISWSRIFPTRTGGVNPEGVAFYDHIVDTLLEYGIEPYVTLYHWDLPIYLLREGGWLSRSTVEAFKAYSTFLFQHFRDRVKLWATINEPASEVIEGYIQGTHPPQEHNYAHAFQASHLLNIASAEVIKQFRVMKTPGGIGIVLNPMPIDVLEPTDENCQARDFAYAYLSDWYLSPSLRGTYPAEFYNTLRKMGFAPAVEPGDEKLMQDNLGDYLGINYYMRRVVEAYDNTARDLEKRFTYVRVPGGSYTKWGWEIYPQGLSDLLHRIYSDYGKQKIMISENGIGFDDQPDCHGAFYDKQRIDYLSRHIKTVLELKRSGFDIAGYYVWSAIDLLSWTNGYQKRYGLIGVDFDTLERRIKQSGYWYRDFIQGAASQG